MPNTDILIIDSGIGGMSIAKEILSLANGVKLTYLADTKYYPYGVKPEQEVTARVKYLLSKTLPKYQPDICVLACNTASTIALEALRAEYHTPFIGVVPAIKPAVEQSESSVIGLLATQGTVRRRYTDELIEEYGKNSKILKYGSALLVEAAEDYMKGQKLNLTAVKQDLNNLFNQDIRMDTVVLACTHFPILKKQLQELFPSVKFWIDSGEAIARRVVYWQAQLGQDQQSPTGEPTTFICTSKRLEDYNEKYLKVNLGEFVSKTLLI